MTEPEEWELIGLAREGDSRAFEALVTRYYETMYAIAYKWTRNAADAEDVTQNACIRFARGIGSLNNPALFRTWLYRLVLNAVRDFQRQVGRIHLHEAAEETAPQQPGTDASPESALYAKEILAEVYALPEKERDAVLLVFGGDLSHGEAAQVLRVAESTVSWRIHSARKRLVKKMEGKNSRRPCHG